jgi:hypothetical protein
MIVSYNTTSSLVRFENKKYLLLLWKNAIAYYNAGSRKQSYNHCFYSYLCTYGYVIAVGKSVFLVAKFINSIKLIRLLVLL